MIRDTALFSILVSAMYEPSERLH